MNIIHAMPELTSTERVASSWSFIVVHDPAGMRQWQWDCVKDLLATDEAILVATVAVPADRATPQPWSRRVYDRWVTSRIQAWDIAARPRQAETIPHLTMGGDALPFSIDFILDFTTEGFASSALSPQFGTWRFRFGDAARGEIPASRETAWRSSTIGISLISIQAAQQSTLHKATIKTRRSHAATISAVLAAAVAVSAGGLLRLRAGCPFPSAPSETRKALPPSSPLHIIGGQLVRSFRRLIQMAFYEDIWSIGVLDMSIEEVIATDNLPEPAWREIKDDRQFQADPFPLEFAGTPHVLFEQYDPLRKRGHIAVAELNDVTARSQRVAIDLGCHMSYPAVFEHAGQVYCAPETHELGGLRLFAMGEDPADWVEVAHLLPEVPLIDATILEKDGLWWLMATRKGDASDTDLHAWHASSPFGPWTPHRLNPLKSDVTSSRPAGNFFRSNGRLFRPAQDCAAGYGTAVVINEVVRLDPSQFTEVESKRLTPAIGWRFADGMHTLNVMYNQVVMDAKRCTFTGRRLAIPSRH